MLIIGGREYDTPNVISKNWKETGLDFVPGRGASKRGTRVVDLAVVHWTGGEGTAAGVHAVLSQRDLGVEFCIDREGVIWQFADPQLVDTWDAGSVNPRSWGVEVINYAVDMYGGKMAKHAAERGTTQMDIHGVKYTVAKFFPKQIKALKVLLEVVNGILRIPNVLPKDKNGVLLATVMDPEDLKRYSGIVGHYHITKTKIDPGIEVWWDLNKEGMTFAGSELYS